MLGLERLELDRVPLLQVERAERALPADLRRGPRRSPELARRAQALVDQLAR